MSTTDEKTPIKATAVPAATDDVATATTTADADTATVATATAITDAVVDQERSEKILKAKELYSHGSRNYLVKSYAEAADELSEVCALYEQLHGELSDELGMPYLLYAKSLIALALDENKVIDVPDEEDEDDNDEDDNDEDEEMEQEASANGEAKGAAATNGKKLDAIDEVSIDDAKKKDEADSTVEKESVLSSDKTDEKVSASTSTSAEEAQVSSTNDAATASAKVEKTKNGDTSGVNGKSAVVVAASSSTAADAPVAVPVMDGEKPSTSNGAAGGDAENGGGTEEEENEAASSLQLAWEILELAAKIFSRQGLSGLPNLAEVQTELANIEFENNILEAAREDYEKALKIYGELPTNYRRAMAEIHYKIGLTYLMQQLNKEGAESLKDACKLIEGEIKEIQTKNKELTEKDKNNIQDMEETKQEIWAKISEIEDTQAQNIAEVRAALDSYIKPISSQKNTDGAGTSSAVGSASGPSSSGNGAASSSSAITSSSKPTDISHLIKRKKPEEGSSEAEASPAKRPAV